MWNERMLSGSHVQFLGDNSPKRKDSCEKELTKPFTVHLMLCAWVGKRGALCGIGWEGRETSGERRFSPSWFARGRFSTPLNSLTNPRKLPRSFFDFSCEVSRDQCCRFVDEFWTAGPV